MVSQVRSTRRPSAKNLRVPLRFLLCIEFNRRGTNRGLRRGRREDPNLGHHSEITARTGDDILSRPGTLAPFLLQ